MNLTPENVAKIKRFVKHVMHELGLKGKCKIVLSGKPTGLPTAGYYSPDTDEIVVACKNRAVADVMRTCAHELVHMQQRQHGTEFPSDDESLQPYEDEANTLSGRYVRFHGREHHDIYEDLSEAMIRKGLGIL